MPTYNPAMQKAHLAAIKADEHGLISKKPLSSMASPLPR